VPATLPRKASRAGPPLEQTGLTLARVCFCRDASEKRSIRCGHLKHVSPTGMCLEHVVVDQM
jgi:hypothetical protein